LKEEAPQLAKVFEGLIGKINELSTVATRVQQSEQDATARTVQEAIDSIPKLAFVQSSDEERFNVIVQIDQWARQQAAFKDLPLTNRFEKVVAMYEAAHGQIALPASASGGAKQPSDAKSKADAAIAKALENAAPNTLTDIPGGNPPPANDMEAAQNMSGFALTDRFMQMTPDQMEKYLAKFG
jgi:hypothetical protein